MSPIALGLLLIAAALHAGWNLLARQATDRQAMLFWALTVAGLLLTPTLALDWPPRWEGLALVFASSVFETLYFLALVGAYEVGDFSVVYPVARGSAPLLIALWAAMFLGERPSVGGWAGIGLVVSGLLLVSAPPNLEGWKRPGRALGLALATGLCTSGYSMLNKIGVTYVFAPTFTCLFHLSTAIMLTPILLRAEGRKLFEPWRRDRFRLILVGAMLGGASVLVLIALSLERASYVGSVREVSVIFGALAGWLVLGEPLGRRRTAAATIMFAGLALIATLG